MPSPLRRSAIVAVAAGLVLSVAGCAGQAPKVAATVTTAHVSAAAASSAAAPVATSPVATPAPSTTPAPAPVRTAAAPRTTAAASAPAPAPAPAPSVSRTVHLTAEQCGPMGLTYDVVFSDGHRVSQSSGPTPSIPAVTVAGPAPYTGTFSVDDPAVDC